MPKYDLKCTVKRDGKSLTGRGVDLPEGVGDRLVARKLATRAAAAKAPAPEPAAGKEPDAGKADAKKAGK